VVSPQVRLCMSAVSQAQIKAVVAVAGLHRPLISSRVCSCGQAQAPRHQQAQKQVTRSAGGTSAPFHARFLLRSIAAFQGCAAAVFFSPGAGSLAVARECVRSGLPVFAFSPAMPAAVPSVSGSWVASSFHGFACWQWVAPVQLSLI
jgi:hypothetical protein